MRRTAIAVAFVLWAGLSPALAERRVALVIGNSNYVDVPTLENPRNDAEDVAAALKRLGFETVLSLDADRDAMQKAVDEFSAQVEGADVALFYYAGHAMQHQGVNYLIPVDGNLSNAAGLRRMTKLNDIVSDVKRAKALRIMVLDACRDNPLTEKLDGGNMQVASAAGASRSAGLAKISRTMAKTATQSAELLNRGGDIIVYAAEAGHTAADGVARNSPFSAAFVKYVETEGQEVVSLMRRITTAVQEDTKGAQRPELSLAVPFEFYFKPGPPAPPPTVAQLLPGAKPHEVGGIESQVDAILNAAPAKDRDQARRELMALLSEMVQRSGLKSSQIVVELPKAFSRLIQMRAEIEEFRRLMENEPGIAPFIEIAAAAVSSGRRPDLQAADQALAQAQARYDEAVRQRTDALDRARSNRAALSEQRGNIAETEYRSRDAANFYLAAAKDTPDSEPQRAARRFAMAGNALFVYGDNFFSNDSLQESIRLNQSEALPRFEKIVSTDNDEAKKIAGSKAIVLAAIADAQTKLGSRMSGIEGARMMVEARRIYAQALKAIDIGDFPGLAMDILDRRAARDIEFGRRMVRDKGHDHFAGAISTRRTILQIQSNHDGYKEELGRARNNLAEALQEASRRTDGEEGDKQIDEAVALLELALEVLEKQPSERNKFIGRANLAQALALRAGRKEGAAAQADVDRAHQLFVDLDRDLPRDREPQLWSTVKRFEAEFLRIVGEKAGDKQESFASLKASFETYQKSLVFISRETAPNDWAMVCAEMGYTAVAALPLLAQSDQIMFARTATQLFDAARPYFAAGGFGQDVQKLDAARQVAQRIADPNSVPAPAQKN
jgi:uncharacterized caspase-like protein